MKRGTITTILAILAFGALLLFNTLAAQKSQCDVCVEFSGKQNCASASHENAQEAARSAQTTACGVLASGMDESIACGRVKPLSVRCHSK